MPPQVSNSPLEERTCTSDLRYESKDMTFDLEIDKPAKEYYAPVSSEEDRNV